MTTHQHQPAPISSTCEKVTKNALGSFAVFGYLVINNMKINNMKTIIALFFALLTTPLAQAESSIETILALLCNDGEYIKFIVINTGKTNIEVTDIYCSYSGKKSDPEGKEFMEKLKNAKLGERFINPDYGVNITSFQASPIVLKPTEAVCLVKVRSDLNVTFKIGINGQLMTPKTIDVDMTKVFEDLTKKPAKAN